MCRQEPSSNSRRSAKDGCSVGVEARGGYEGGTDGGGVDMNEAAEVGACLRKREERAGGGEVGEDCEEELGWKGCEVVHGGGCDD